MQMVTDPTPHQELVRAVWTERKGKPFPSPKRAGQSFALRARVNHGRWIILCPDCLSAVLANRKQAEFFCTACGNTAVGGAWRPVVWPSDADMHRIEQVLSGRPLEETRNWLPGEPVAALAAENTAMPKAEAMRWGEGPNGEALGWQRALDPETWGKDVDIPKLHPATAAWAAEQRAANERAANASLEAARRSATRTADDPLPGPVVGPTLPPTPGSAK